MKHNYLRGIKVDDLQLSRCRFNAVNVNFITVGDESYFGSRTTRIIKREAGHNGHYVATQQSNQSRFYVAFRHVHDKQNSRRILYRTVNFRYDEFIWSDTKFRPLEFIYPRSSVIQVLEVIYRHICNSLADVADEFPTIFYELHKGAHVRLASAATDWTSLAEIDCGREGFSFFKPGERRANNIKWNGRLLQHIWRFRTLLIVKFNEM